MFSSGLDLTMVGLDVTHQALMSRRTSSGSPAAVSPASSSPTCTASTSEHHRRRYGWDGAPVHDAVAVAHVIDGTLLETSDCGVVVDTGPGALARAHLRRPVGQPGWPPNCHVAVDIDAERFLELLIERIARLGWSEVGTGAGRV